MSRIGQNPIKIKDNVKINIEDNANEYGGQNINVNGKLGDLTIEVRKEIEVKENDGYLELEQSKKVDTPDRKKSAYHGLYRSLIANAIEGVVDGYSKELEIVGIGYKAEVRGDKLMLTIGLNHPVEFEIPEGIKIEVNNQVELKVTGIDKQKVGEVAASIRRVKKPEPYKGKGIRYKDEVVRRKEGKTAA